MTRSRVVCGVDQVDSMELFADLSRDQRREVAALAIPRACPGGARLFEAGDEARELYVVCRGQVELTFPLQVLGRPREIRFQVLEQGSTLAWSALVSPHRLTMSARAVGDAEVCAFPRQGLTRLFEADPVIGRVVITRLAQVIAARLVEFQALWVKEMERNVSQAYR